MPTEWWYLFEVHFIHLEYSWFPLRLENWKKIPVREFWTDWKSRGFLPKILENEGILPKKNWEILASFYFYFFWHFNWSVCVKYIYEIKQWKSTGKGKNTGNVREICQSEDVVAMIILWDLDNVVRCGGMCAKDFGCLGN